MMSRLWILCYSFSRNVWSEEWWWQTGPDQGPSKVEWSGRGWQGGTAGTAPAHHILYTDTDCDQTCCSPAVATSVALLLHANNKKTIFWQLKTVANLPGLEETRNNLETFHIWYKKTETPFFFVFVMKCWCIVWGSGGWCSVWACLPTSPPPPPPPPHSPPPSYLVSLNTTDLVFLELWQTLAASHWITRNWWIFWYFFLINEN